MKFIDLNTQAARIETNLVARFKAILEHGAYIMGPEVEALEIALADFVGVKHAIGVSSGTDALLIALMALGIGPGDEVITTPFSFFATVEVIALLGAKAVFVDINRETYNLDADRLEAAITNKTKAIMPVNMYGQCAEYTKINAIAAKYQLPVIEDGAQSFGATYYDSPSCGLTTIGCTSFFPAKPLGAYGDAGACFTNDDELADRMKSIRVHGQEKRYEHIRVGINGRLDSIQAAVLLEKLTLFPEELEVRQAVASRYTNALSGFVKTPTILSCNKSAFAQYTIEVSNRAQVQKVLESQGIPTAVHYPMALHKQPALCALYPEALTFPNAEAAAAEVLSLPMHPYLEAADQMKVVDALKAVLYAEERERIET